MRRLPTVPVVLAGAAAFLELYATQPLLPLLARTFGASPFQVGLTITAPTVAVAIFAPVVGRLADRVGLRRVIVGSAVGLSVTTALAATASTLPALIMWRFLQGVLTPGVFAATVAYIHEVWPAARAGRATAAYVSGTVVGGFTGRAVAGIVAADASWPMAFLALSGLAAIVATILGLWLPHEHHHRPAAAPSPPLATRRTRASLRHLLGRRPFVAALGVGFATLFTQVALFTYVTFHLAGPPFMLSTVALGSLFAVYLVGAAITPLAGRLVDRTGHRQSLAVSMAVAAAGTLLTLVASVPVVVAGLALTSTGVFMAQATTSSFVGSVTTRDRALAIGLYSSLYYAGGSAGAALPAAFWARGGWPGCVGLVVFMQVVGTAIALTHWRRTSPQHDLLMPDGGG